MRDSTSARRRLSFDEYMAWEAVSTRRHEFVNGEVYALAGVTRRHDLIAGNVYAHFRAAARGTACQAHTSDMKVRVAADVSYYPDASVDCVSPPSSDLFIDQPCVVVEVTSRHSARTDRGEKLENYRGVPSLRVYLVVDQNRRRVTCHRRDHAGAWIVEDVEGYGSIDIPCPALRLTLDDIYEGVEMPPLGVAEPELDEETGEYVVER